MAELWASQPQAVEMSSRSMRSQLLCLTAYLDPGPSSRAAYVFVALSHACHYHPYELAPTGAERMEPLAPGQPWRRRTSGAPRSVTSPSRGTAHTGCSRA